MPEPLETIPPLITALLSLIPIAALSGAYRRVRSTRLLLALAAFTVFFLSGVVLLVDRWRSGDSTSAEWIEFASDVLIMTLFALSFLWPRAEPAENAA